MVLVVKEAINSPWSSRMKAVGRAVWVVGSNTPKEREISPVLSSTRGMLRPFREVAANSLKKIGWHTLHRRNLCASIESVEMATMGHSLPSSEEASALRKLADTGRKSP